MATVPFKASWSKFITYHAYGDYYVVEGVRIDSKVFKSISKWLDHVETTYEEDVLKKVVTILTKSLRELKMHRTEDFVPFGDYRVFDNLVAQLRREADDPYFEPRPYLVALYGPPGTGKTTWVRNVAKKYLFRNGILKGVYLELTSGDLQSKWAGVPVNTLRAILDCVKTVGGMSVLLMDEADAILLKPDKVSEGVALEQAQLVAEMKSQLTFISSHSVPVLIALTTNYKDVIANSDPALADRVVAWIQVPPPPLPVRERIVMKILANMFRDLWLKSDPLGQVNILRAIKYGAPVFFPKKKLKVRWTFPVLPYEADYIVAYLSAWGWNPLDPSVLPALEKGADDVANLWSPDVDEGGKTRTNYLLRVFARGLITEVELARLLLSGSGTPKSFLRTLATLRRGVEDAGRFIATIWIEGMEDTLDAARAKEEYRWSEVRKHLQELGELGAVVPSNDKALKYVLKFYAEALKDTLFTTPVPPVAIHVLAAKYVISEFFTQLVNDVHSMLSYIVCGLRMVFPMPFLYTGDDPYSFAASVRLRLKYYGKFIKEQLLYGKVLEPLRIIYTEPDPEVAWRETVKALEGLEPDVREPVAVALLPLKHLHPAIHAKEPEEKARHIYELYKDRDSYEQLVWRTAKELGVQESIYYVKKPFTASGVYVIPKDDYVTRSADETSIFNSSITEYFPHSIYHPGYHIDGIGTIANGPYLLAKELVMKKKEDLNKSVSS